MVRGAPFPFEENAALVCAPGHGCWRTLNFFQERERRCALLFIEPE